MTLLNDQMQRRLLEAGVFKIVLCLDAASPETHKKIRIGADYQECLNNITSFLKMKGDGGFKTRTHVQLIKMKLLVF